MQHFLTQLKKEFTSFFSGFMPYVIIGSYYILSFFLTLYFGDYLLRESDVMNAYFIMQPFVLILIIPAITMRSWSEEVKSGTIELLLTQPISYFSLVIAKYFAAFGFFVLLILSSIPFLIISNLISVLDWGSVISAYCGLFLCGAMFTAAGCLISTFCRNNITSFICTIFLLFFISQFKPIDINVANVLIPLSIFNFDINYEAFFTGALAWSNIVYFIIGTVLLVWLNIVALEYIQSNKKNEKTLLKTFFALVFIIFFSGVLSTFFIFQNTIDVTHNKLYTITEQNKNYLNTFNKRIDITLYEAQQKREQENSNYAAYASFVEKFLAQIQKQSFNTIRYTVVRVEAFSMMERRIVNENIPYEEDALGNKVYMFLDVSDNNGNNVRINALHNLRQNLLEADIMRAIRLLGQEKKNIAIVAEPNTLNHMQGFYNFLTEFYNVNKLDFSLQYLPSTYDAVIVINPYKISTEFLLALDQYLLAGGSIAMFIEPRFIKKRGDTYLVDFLKNYGIKPVPENIIEPDNDFIEAAEVNTPDKWKDIRFIFVNEVGEVNVRDSQLFKVSPMLIFNNKNMAVLSEGNYVTHFPEVAAEFQDILPQSKKIGKFSFVYDSDIIYDDLYISSDSKGHGFYQVVTLADNVLFYIQLIDKLTNSKTEEELNYKHYPMNLSNISSFILNIQKQRNQEQMIKLQNKIEAIKSEMNNISNDSVHNLGRISKLTQDLEKAEDNLNLFKHQILKNYQTTITALTVLIILIIPAILLCLLFVILRMHRKYAYAKIGRLFSDDEAH